MGEQWYAKFQLRHPWSLRSFSCWGFQNSHSEFCSPPTPFLASTGITHMRAGDRSLQLFPKHSKMIMNVMMVIMMVMRRVNHNIRFYWGFPCARLWCYVAFNFHLHNHPQDRGAQLRKRAQHSYLIFTRSWSKKGWSQFWIWVARVYSQGTGCGQCLSIPFSFMWLISPWNVGGPNWDVLSV